MSIFYFSESWLQFKHSLVRQLAFCIASPNILTQIPEDLRLQHTFALHNDQYWHMLYQRYEPRLQQLDLQPQPLIDFLARLKSTRLGLRFEYLLWFWLQDQSYHPYQLLGHSIQKIEGTTTLGELDFLLFNQQTQEIEHWEVALKYYLGEGLLGLTQWFGLNRQDTLQRKLQHFTDRQFQFVEANSYKIQRKFAIIKGQLYLPSYHKENQLPTWLNPSRRIGVWGTYIPQLPYYRLQRHEWLCPDLHRSFPITQWWSNGLYYHNSTEPLFYMYRQPALILQ